MDHSFGRVWYWRAPPLILGISITILHSSVKGTMPILPDHLVQLCSNSWGPWSPKFGHIRENVDHLVHLCPNSRYPSCRLDLITKEAGNPNSRETDQILSYLASNHPGGGWCLSSLPKFSWTSSDSCSNPHSCWFDLVRGTRNLNSSRGVKSCHISQATIQTDGN